MTKRLSCPTGKNIHTRSLIICAVLNVKETPPSWAWGAQFGWYVPLTSPCLLQPCDKDTGSIVLSKLSLSFATLCSKITNKWTLHLECLFLPHQCLRFLWVLLSWGASNQLLFKNVGPPFVQAVSRTGICVNWTISLGASQLVCFQH